MSTDTVPTVPHVSQEIARQPDSWTRAVGLAGDVAGVLPRAGESVAVIGCGTSLYMAAAYASLRESAGHGRTDAFPASEVPAGREYDRMVAISRSGTTTEVVQAIEQTRAPVVALTALADSPVSDAATDTVLLDFADEQSVVQTLFATTTLMLLRASLSPSDDTALDAVIAQAREVLAGEHRVDAATAQVEQISFLGRHWAVGVAQEAGLKLREACRLWTESYPQMEYRHGPISIAQPGRAVWVFGEPVPGLADDVRRTGALLVDDRLDPVADLVRAQLLAVDRAQAASLDPDQPRSLTRSVVLTDS